MNSFDFCGKIKKLNPVHIASFALLFSLNPRAIQVGLAEAAKRKKLMESLASQQDE